MVLIITSRVATSVRKSIPVVVTGMLLCFTASAEELTQVLFEQGKWQLCRRECQRERLSQTNDASRTELMELACKVRMKPRDDQRLVEQFTDLADRTTDREVAAIASYEAGRLLWELNAPEKALEAFSFSFYTTTNNLLFLKSACSAFLLMNDHKALKAKNPELVQQINTSRELWDARLFAECRLETEKVSIFAQPAYAVIHFYRSQISPAIGWRCTLEPSCSEYFVCAVHRHGSLMALPMIADRLVREPTVNDEKQYPVWVNGMRRYKDPVEDHDFWMKP